MHIDKARHSVCVCAELVVLIGFIRTSLRSWLSLLLSDDKMALCVHGLANRMRLASGETAEGLTYLAGTTVHVSGMICVYCISLNCFLIVSD